ncbi:GMC family oxidoreductase [Streptomyces sp. NPDC005281]|uniref:GMC family oxidoreductase n=1 Tax=Streptomyces sp. NPDC005281 TaxID=3155712 RepID=UPI0033AEFC23
MTSTRTQTQRSKDALTSGYDVVIVGGGVAGCVLASRLSEDEGRTVCLVEAGPDYGPDRRAWPRQLLDAHALSRNDVWERRTDIHRIRARVLGGSSCINGCWHTWGAIPDHEDWERAGGSHWSAAAMEPYRRRAVEQMRLRTVPDQELSAWARAALDGARELGYATVDMGTSGGPGCGTPLINALDGLRWNAAFAYLELARDRPNLTIQGETRVDRLRVRNGRVRGVEVVVKGKPETLVADTYLVACGAFGSPALLLRSGLGPASHLEEMRIRPEIDLPGVGANLTDQPSVFVPMTPTAELNAALAVKEEAGELYVNRMLIRAASEACPPDSWDLHIVPSAGNPLFGSLPPGQYEAGISALLMKPASRGQVRLRSADPTEPLDIDPAFLTDPDGRDEAVLRSGLAVIERLAATTAFKRLAAPIKGHPSSELSGTEMRARLGTYWHPVGTCAMGRSKDPSAVVDGEGRVRGVDNLLVADASILPTVPAANTQLVVLTLAELLAGKMTETTLR